MYTKHMQYLKAFDFKFTELLQYKFNCNVEQHESRSNVTNGLTIKFHVNQIKDKEVLKKEALNLNLKFH